MIPKTIHYCWFGKTPKPSLAKKCINSWKKQCADYKIIEWNEENFDIASAPLYVRQAYEARKWAFVTDYVRLKVVYDNGGIYLDTDVELVKPLDLLLHEQAFFGFEYGDYIATGLGFGAEKGVQILHEMMEDYSQTSFIMSDGSFDLTPCPVRNSQVFIRKGLKQDNSKQYIAGCLILPSEFLCPYDGRKRELVMTEETISIHWYGGSWVPKNQRRSKAEYMRIAKWKNLWHTITHFPNRMAICILGKETYEKIKRRIKRV